MKKLQLRHNAHSIKIQDSAKGIRLSVFATCSQTRQKPKSEEIPIATNGNG
jgi:hypothetical protein